MAMGPLAAAMIVATAVTTSHAANDVFATSSAAGTIESRKPIVELDLPSGKYAILGKINIDQDNDSAYVTVVCTLSQGGIPLDVNVITLQPSSVSFLDNGTIPFQAVRDLRGNYTIGLACTFSSLPGQVVFPGGNRTLSFGFARITAIRVQGILCEHPSPAVCPDQHPVP
jgi:hypothetical protein